MGSRTHFWRYKALVWIRKGSLQRISSLYMPSLLWRLCRIICIVTLELLRAVHKNRYN
ncbi:MAG: hypothetical protein ACMUEL_06315 [Flavobacteriales bacterium Tduv]